MLYLDTLFAVESTLRVLVVEGGEGGEEGGDGALFGLAGGERGPGRDDGAEATGEVGCAGGSVHHGQMHGGLELGGERGQDFLAAGEPARGFGVVAECGVAHEHQASM